MYNRTNWNEMATEILESVFRLLNDEKSSFLQYQLVNKHWYRTSQRVFYRHLYVSCDPFNLRQEEGGLNMDPIERTKRLLNHASFDVGTQVRRVFIHYEGADDDVNLNFWKTLIAKCPFVREVHYHFELTEKLANGLISILNQDKNHWRFLEKFEAQSFSEEAEKIYSDFLYKIGSTRLKEIELFKLPDEFGNNLIKYVEQFSKLSRLNIASRGILLRSVFDIEELLNVAPHLIELAIDWRVDTDEESNGLDTNMLVLDAKSKVLEECKPYNQMERLRFCFFSPKHIKDELEYITKKFPKLREIEVKGAIVDRATLSQQAALTSTAAETIRFVCTLEDYHFSLRHHFDLLSAKLYFDIFSETAQGTKGLEIGFLKDNKTQRFTVCNHNCSETESYSLNRFLRTNVPWMKIELDGQSILCSSESDSEHHQLSDQESKPIDTFIEMVGSKLSVLRLKSSLRNGDSVLRLLGYAISGFPSFGITMFEYPIVTVLNKCPSLKSLSIIHGDFEEYNESTIKQLHSDSLETLSIEDSLVPPTFFTQLSEKRCLPNLRNLHIRGCGYFASHEEILYLPQAELDMLSLSKTKSFHDLCASVFDDLKEEVNVRVTTTAPSGPQSDHYYYYCSDFEKKKLIPTMKQAYTVTSAFDTKYTLHLTCRSIKRLTVDMMSGVVALNLCK
ncbi:hypothetical protein A0J61_02246 [Choanephora cucurbitarum]|uniref:Uncharacterized protein n=1 Tax=Choanephora cucurbitarum TaxID=101091 RepID=A0A1C7NKM4_9FUNG|nr:hypothetical protein A0J61_02246 [Choanephora cucurbitarum]